MPTELIAHRGAPREHPENSLPGFAAALAHGADAIELDVQCTADGVPVVHHDPALGAGPHAGADIARLTAEQVRAHPLAPGIAVPTLAEVVTLVGDRATLYVEVKAAGAEEAVVRALSGVGAGAPVHSFDHRVSRRVRALRPHAPVGVLSTSYLIDSVAAMRDAGARDLWQHWSMIDAPLVEDVHAAGGRVIAWTVNDAEVARALVGLGVDGVCTDIPGALRSAV